MQDEQVPANTASTALPAPQGGYQERRSPVAGRPAVAPPPQDSLMLLELRGHSPELVSLVAAPSNGIKFPARSRKLCDRAASGVPEPQAASPPFNAHPRPSVKTHVEDPAHWVSSTMPLPKKDTSSWPCYHLECECVGPCLGKQHP